MLKGLRKKASILLLTSQSLQQSAPSSSTPDPSSYDKVLKQVRDFELALQAMDYLLDDRTNEGTKLLHVELKKHSDSRSEQPAAIFHLALGVMEFIEATLGFEPEVMAKAHTTLTEAESSSLNNSKYNVKHLMSTSHIYPPGTEFQVTYAESTLLNALLMLLQENSSMVESAKALFKLRKAYQTLDTIYKKIKELEPVFNKNLAKFRKEASLNKSLSTVDLPGYTTPASSNSSSASLPQDLKLIKNLEQIFQMRKARVEGTSLYNLPSGEKVNLFKSELSSANVSRRPSSYLLNNPSKSTNTSSSANGRSVSPNPHSVSQNSKFININNNSPSSSQKQKLSLNEDDVEDDEDDFFSDALDTHNEHNYKESLNTPSLSESNVHGTSESIISSVTSNSSFSNNFTNNTSTANDVHLHVSTIDEFIHSGVQLCFGILQVVLSLIPPAIGKVLSIVGFRGDRDTGLKMLWRTAITSRNIHGELALLCLLVFYDGPIQFVDVGFQIPSDKDSNVKSVLNIENLSSINDSDITNKVMKNPNLYTPQVLSKARKLFPHNGLWILQEGRILASQGSLDEATNLMQGFTDNPDNHIQMQQVKSLLTFDRAMLYTFKHEFDEAARDFISLVDMSSWTQGLYLFLAASCYLAKWRMIKIGLIEQGNPNKEALLQKYAKLAEKYFKEAPSYVPNHGLNATNKKGGIGGGNKQMPFDKFLLRKMKHIEDNIKRNPGIAFIECIGTSPIHELMYFWNGYNRMQEKHLNWTFTILGFTGSPNSSHSLNSHEFDFSSIEETRDESMIRYFLQSITLRQLGKNSEGLKLLDAKVIPQFVTQDSVAGFRFNKLIYSPYLYPTVLYEKTMFVWIAETLNPNLDVKHAVKESQVWLKKAEIVSDVGDYELSNRTSMRIKAAGDRLEQLAAEAK